MRWQSEALGAPRPSQRNQRKSYSIGSVPVQLPRVVRKTSPTRAVPLMLGSLVFCGATCGAADDELASSIATVASAAARATAPGAARPDWLSKCGIFPPQPVFRIPKFIPVREDAKLAHYEAFTYASEPSAYGRSASSSSGNAVS